jgi:predicted nucleotidyltransferase
MDKAVQQLVEKLQKAYGDRLVSVVLYGSAAGGDHDTRFSDYNVLCVLSRITPRELADSEAIFRWWRELGSPAPLLLTELEVETSTDCFAIEFSDIQRQHQLLAGKDVISTLVVERTFYRAQVEHDLRAKLLRLRQKASGMLSDAALLRRLLLDSVSTFCVLFRHALILDGAGGPAAKREVIARASEHFGFDPLPFDKLLAIREQQLKAREVEPVALLGAYLEAINVVIAAVDRLEK